jgi:flagellar biosynthesis/type III secretory pathway protein FliH
MTVVAITDCEAVLTAVSGQRIPRRAWANVGQLSSLLSEAGRILQTTKRQTDLLQRRAYFDGRAAGASHAQAEAMKHVLEAQRQSREFMDASHARIVELAVAIVARIAPKLDQGELVAALASEGLNAITEERHLSIRVSAGAETATRGMLDKWKEAHPEVASVELVVDSTLEPLDCVVESELGRLEVGLSAQLEAVSRGLRAIAAEVPR